MKGPVNRTARLRKAAYLLSTLIGLSGLMALFITFNPSVFIPDEEQDITHWEPRSIEADLPPDQSADTINYGYQLITNTSLWIGPMAVTGSKRFAGNNLSCSNCHLKAGRKAGSGAFAGVTNRYPQFRGRENKMGTIEDRING